MNRSTITIEIRVSKSIAQLLKLGADVTLKKKRHDFREPYGFCPLPLVCPLPSKRLDRHLDLQGQSPSAWKSAAVQISRRELEGGRGVPEYEEMLICKHV